MCLIVYPGDRLTVDQGKRIFIKDITYYLLPPQQQVARIAPSLAQIKRGVGTSGLSIDHSAEHEQSASNGVHNHDANGSMAPFPYKTRTEEGNPTIIPQTLLEQFHYTFLIRHPRSSIPSYYRCCIPPLLDRTGFAEYMPSEAGYDELRRFFDYCRASGFVGPAVAGQNTPQPASKAPEICVIDADDLLDDPEGILRKYCKSVGLEFDSSMLKWDDEELHQYAKETFEKWDGFHDDAIHSKDLKPRTHVSIWSCLVH